MGSINRLSCFCVAKNFLGVAEASSHTWYPYKRSMDVDFLYMIFFVHLNLPQSSSLITVCFLLCSWWFYLSYAICSSTVARTRNIMILRLFSSTPRFYEFLEPSFLQFACYNVAFVAFLPLIGVFCACRMMPYEICLVQKQLMSTVPKAC